MNVQQVSATVKQSLRNTGYSQVAGIEIIVTLEPEEMITLRGGVRSFYMKQIAQEAAKVNGFRVNNEIKVAK